MKIKVYKNCNEYLTRDYDLTNCSVEEFAEALIRHCLAVEVEPLEAAIIAVDELRSNYESIIKGISTKMTMNEVAVELLKLAGRDVAEQCVKKAQDENPNITDIKTKSFANGCTHFCPDCSVFFSIQLDKDFIGQAEFCAYCGEDNLLTETADLLDYCEEYDTDPVNFYKAFPPDEPIPQSRTGATPRQVEIIIGLAAEKKRHGLPVTAESLAGESEFYRGVVEKVFEELHITEAEGGIK